MPNLETAITEVVGKMAGRKNGAAIIGMAFLYLMRDQGWQTLAMVAGLAGLCIALQFMLDIVEVWRTGKDLPENGNGDTVAQPVVNPTPDGTSQR